MKIPLKLGILLIVLAVFCRPASGIVVEDYDVAVTNPPAGGDWDLNWDNVYNYKNSSAVAVGSHWILTAAHVADDTPAGTIVVEGVTCYPQQIIFHASVDLALVRFDKPFPGFYPLYTGSFPKKGWPWEDNRLDAVMVGYGKTGTVHNTYYKQIGGGNGIKRWGSQKIDETDNQNYLIVDTRVVPWVTNGTYNSGIKMEFGERDTDYEAGVGVYDSGGGTFVKSGGIWKLAGINTTRYGGPNYTGTFAVSVPAYETWITDTMDSVTGDSDGDGIPDWWEEQYLTNIVAGADQDGDGFTGEEEYISDTDPVDSNSYWRVDRIIVGSDQVLSFQGSTGRQYQLYSTTNGLADTNLNWNAQGAPVWGVDPDTKISTTNLENRAFFRAEVILP